MQLFQSKEIHGSLRWKEYDNNCSTFCEDKAICIQIYLLKIFWGKKQRFRILAVK